jgi:DNA-binding PadR family transcriptional regulator
VAITTTAACVLGILQMGPAPGQPGFRESPAMTGGQIYAAAERSVSRFWNLTRSQVYSELGRLEDAGFVEPVGAAGDRGAQPYAVTDAGRAEFRGWMHDFVAEGPREDQLRSPLLLAVFFGHFVEPDRLRVLLDEYKARHERSLALANDMLAALGDDRSLPGAALLRRAGYEQLMVDWLAETSSRISEPSEPTKTSTSQPRRRSR